MNQFRAAVERPFSPGKAKVSTLRSGKGSSWSRTWLAISGDIITERDDQSATATNKFSETTSH